MATYDQLLPEDESFAAPDWLAATDGSGAYNAPPYLFHYLAYNPTTDLNPAATEYSAYPLKTGGAMEVVSSGALFTPQSGAPGGAMPVNMTDEVGGALDKLRAVLCRAEDSANYDNLSLEVTFGLEQISGVTTGITTQGRNGSGPTPQGVRRISTADLAVDDTDNQAFYNNNLAGYTGPIGPFEPIGAKPRFNGWLGNGLIMRAGGGHPEVAEDGDGRWCVSGVNAYILLVYPVKNSSNIDLHMKLYRQNHGGAGAVGVPTLLASHIEANGYSLIRFRQRLRLRLEVDTNGSGDVELKAFIHPIQHGSHYDEHQIFKASDWSNETILAGPSGDASVATNTGIVTDSGAGKIATYADTTFGWIMGRDRILDIYPWTGEHRMASVVEGVYRVTLTEVDTETVRYNDRFQRTSQGSQIALQTVDDPVFGGFNSGARANGLWVHDGSAQSFGSGDAKVAPLAIWTDSTTDTTSPNDYLQTYLDPSPATGNLVGGVPRFYTYKRPSTQFYNHHRIVTVVGPDDSTSAAANTFAVGVVVRGSLGQRSVSAIGFFAYYTTDGAGNQTSLKFAIAHLDGGYDEDTIGTVITNGTAIALLEKQASGAGIPVGFDMPGTSHTLGLKVQTYSGASSSTAPAVYTAYFDGTAITFDTFTGNASINASDEVTHPNPPTATVSGTSEGFFWWSSLDAVDGSSNANYTLPRWSAWTQGAVDADPDDGSSTGESVAVQDEGVGTVNLSTALGDVDWNIRVEYERPRFDIEFESGHRYTSPRWSRARRSISASAANIDRATMDALVAFYNAREGIQEPFLFDFPIPASSSAETLEEITCVFRNADGLVYERIAEDVYVVSLDMVEIL